MLTLCGKISSKICIDHSAQLFDMAKKLGVLSAFLPSIEIEKNLVQLVWKRKSLNFYALDRSIAFLLRKAADVCRKNFTIKLSDSLIRETINIFVRNFYIFYKKIIKI
ncbi:XRE family transcriptional regulator [Bartonella sp. B35(2025)]